MNNSDSLMVKYTDFKGIVYPEMKILSFTHGHIVQNL